MSEHNFSRTGWLSVWRSDGRTGQKRRLLRWGRSTLALLLGWALALVFHLPVWAQAAALMAVAPGTELRGVWLTNIDSEVLFSQDNIESALDRLKRLNFNTVYPTVWNGGYTLYPSDVAKEAIGTEVEPVPEFEDRDMLKEVVEAGHDRDLSVIAWMEFGLMAPADSELARRHPDWITNRQDGSRVFLMHGDHEMVWLNPTHPQVQDFLVNLVTEVIEDYDVDGIQFDDHFGLPAEAGYDPITVQLYQQEHGGRRPPNDINNPEWKRWRAAKVTDLMVKLYTAIHTRQPSRLLSLAPNPKDFAYDKYLQDWMTWIRLGFLDELIVQVYRNDMNRYTSELDRPELSRVRSRIPVGIGILTGLRLVNVEMQQIQNQVRAARDRRFAGVAFFFYESLGDRDESFQALFPNPAPRPGDRA